MQWHAEKQVELGGSIGNFCDLMGRSRLLADDEVLLIEQALASRGQPCGRPGSIYPLAGGQPVCD